MSKNVNKIQNFTAYVPKSKAGLWACILQLILLYLAVLSTVLCVSTSLAMTVPFYETALICLLSTAVFAVAVFNKISFGVFAGVSAIFVLTFWQALTAFVQTAVSGFKFCYDLGFVIMKMAGWNYTSHMLTDETHILELLKDEALVLSYFRSVIIVLAVFFSFWFVALSWKRPRVWPTVLVAIGILAPGFYIGLAPNPVAFSLLLSCAFGLYMQTLSGRKVHRRPFKVWLKSLFARQENKTRFSYTGKSGIYGLCITGISMVFMLLVALITYQTPLVELDTVREYLDSGSEYVYNRVFYSRLEVPDGSIGSRLSDNEVKLLSLPKIHDVPVMTVQSKHNETFYLRAWVTDDLKNNAWQVLDDGDEAEMKRSLAEGTDPYSFAYRLHQSFVEERLSGDNQKNFGFVTDELLIKAKFHKSLVVHLPTYGTDGEIEGSFEGIDTVATEVKTFQNNRPSGNKYSVRSFNPIITTKGFVTALYALSQKYDTILSTDTSDIESERFQTFLKQERSYAAYAEKHYTDSIGITYDMAQKAEQLAAGHKTQLTKVLAIERFFRDDSAFTYTTSPQLLDGATAMEQIEYSLSENQEGYCSYFATAMTLMVRSLGYPARFVSGYIVRGTDEAEADSYTRTVMDSDCHAWVEVYFDGLGWLSFDPTPDAKETAEQFEARYYALSLEGQSGGTGGSGSASVKVDPFQANYVEERPDDPEEMPTLPKDDFTLQIVQIMLWLAFGCLLLIVLPVILICHTVRKVRRQHQSVYQAGDSPGQTIDRMNQLMHIWLAQKKLTVLPGETAQQYAQRIDETLLTEHKYTDILPILTRCTFSAHPATESDKRKVAEYFEELFVKMHRGKMKIPLWRQIFG